MAMQVNAAATCAAPVIRFTIMVWMSLRGWRRLHAPGALALAGLCVGVLTCSASVYADGRGVEVLKNDLWAVSLQPASLRIAIEPASGPTTVLSEAIPDLGPVRDLVRGDDRLSWNLPVKHLAVSVVLEQRDLRIDVRSSTTGRLSWPRLTLSPPMQALIWPHWEGRYIPLQDAEWREFLIEQGPWNTLEGLCMPFWGLTCDEYTLTFIVTNRYNNRIAFSREGDGFLMALTHEFPPSRKEWGCGLVVHLSDGNSPIEPARQFRRRLIEQGRFRTLAEKRKTVPQVERLRGAIHVYLWGDGLLTRHDVQRKAWRPFCQRIIDESRGDQPSPGKHIYGLMAPEHWKQVEEIAATEWPYRFFTTGVSAELSRLLERAGFYDEAAWKGIETPAVIKPLLARGLKSLSRAELCRLNAELLRAAYSAWLPPVDEWGDGVSVKMLRRFQGAGFDRVRFCVEGVDTVVRRPEVVRVAGEMGYLFGTYDSFHSMHDPKLRGTDATWPTAQFDQDLWESGAILDREGKQRRGFKGRGCKLNPHAARPYVEQRVRRNMRIAPFNHYFVDCDAFGEVYDDYSPLHPSTQEMDARARVDRLVWIGDTFKAVVGSEGGSSFAAPGVHVIEGMFGPLVGWGDADMRDRESPYYQGRYYPPDGPEVFVKPTRLKEKYQRLHYDPQYRLPLNEVVFHDSFVSTHHWSNGSLKYPDVADVVALTEMLYQCPPLYHMNLDEFSKHKARMKRHYECFSSLHREIGFSPLADFTWLSSDHLVQRTVFADEVEIVVNFGTKPFQAGERSIPGRSAVVRWIQTGRTRSYTP